MLLLLFLSLLLVLPLSVLLLLSSCVRVISLSNHLVVIPSRRAPFTPFTQSRIMATGSDKATAATDSQTAAASAAATDSQTAPAAPGTPAAEADMSSESGAASSYVYVDHDPACSVVTAWTYGRPPAAAAETISSPRSPTVAWTPPPPPPLDPPPSPNDEDRRRDETPPQEAMYCKICGFWVDGEQQLERHNRGSHHRNNCLLTVAEGCRHQGGS